MVKTRTPGIYKRGSRYVVVYKVNGRQRKESARTLDDARALKRKRETARDNGEDRPPCRETFADYARRWIAGYQGRGSGFRERTRRDYARDLERYAIPFLGSKRLIDLRREDVRGFVAWLIDDQAQADRHRRENAERKQRADQDRRDNGGGRARELGQLRDPGPLSDRSVERIVAVVKACLSSAMLDELRRDNPASRVVLPNRDPLPDPDDDQEIKALTRVELAAFLAIVHPEWRVFFRLLAATGLRISEALALDVRHLILAGARPHVKVRRAYGPDGMDRPKSRHGVRELPLPQPLVHELRVYVAGLQEVPADVAQKWGRLAFPSAAGTPKDANNLRREVLKPAAEEADVGWAGFHAFRHTFASMHIERGTNIVRLSRLLGHHKPSFTLDVYGHMLDGGMGEPLDLDGELASVGLTVATTGVELVA
jgi:integrase